MARVPLTVIVTDPATGNALTGATVRVKRVDGTTDAVLYAARTGATTTANPMVSDANGRVQSWVDRGLYRLDYAGTGLAAWSEWVALGATADAEIDSAWLPPGSASGQALVWNGTTWGPGTPSPAPYATTLPTNPVDGQEVFLGAAPASGVVWHLRYRTAAAGAYKWDFLGGAAMFALVDASEGTSSTAYGDLTTPGPALTTPVAGDYEIEISALHSGSGAAQSGAIGRMNVQVGAAAPVPADELLSLTPTGAHLTRTLRKAGIAANTAITTKYSSATGGCYFAYRSLRLRPVRVG